MSEIACTLNWCAIFRKNSTHNSWSICWMSVIGMTNIILLLGEQSDHTYVAILFDLFGHLSPLMPTFYVKVLVQLSRTMHKISKALLHLKWNQSDTMLFLWLFKWLWECELKVFEEITDSAIVLTTYSVFF